MPPMAERCEPGSRPGGSQADATGGGAPSGRLADLGRITDVEAQIWGSKRLVDGNTLSSNIIILRCLAFIAIVTAVTALYCALVRPLLYDFNVVN